MSGPFTTCEEGFFQLRFQQQRLGCAFFELAAAVPSSQDISPTIKTISDSELDAMARNYACYRINAWRFIGLCPNLDRTTENQAIVRVNDALTTVNEELTNRNLPTQEGDIGPGGGWQALIVVGVLAVIVLLAMFMKYLSEKFAWFEDSADFKESVYKGSRVEAEINSGFQD